MKIALITTSRADFGIYHPLIELINAEKQFSLDIIAAGMHTSKQYGLTYKLIEQAGFKVFATLETLTNDDSSYGISTSMAKTTEKFAKFWKNNNNYELVICLGDRFEMFAAVSSITPFNIPIAHIHGGETTLGAIDNKFRHAITCLSDIHFTSHEEHSKKVASIIGTKNNVFNVGSLGIDSIKKANLLSSEEFYKKYSFNIDDDYILTTFHPETTHENNLDLITSLIDSFAELEEKILCTLPNADRQGMIIRNELLKFEKANPKKIKCYESLGQIGYLTAMKNCKFMLGNTSSGIIEATSFDIPVINIGDRQKGRISGNNVIHCKIDKESIIKQKKSIENLIGKNFNSPFGDGNSAEKIVSILKTINL